MGDIKRMPRTSAEIREAYLSFFEEKGCKRVASSSLIPDDPSLLLTSAGMVQFKQYFLGKAKMKEIGAATCQKCVRTTDIDVIGLDGRHLSFFEMLGNFSFGGYSKAQACAWAFEFVLEHLKLPLDRLYFSIFEDDDEAFEIWRDLGVSPDRIVRLGEDDNFWAAGPTGPCGPCSEIYFDQGPDAVPCDDPEHCAPGCDCDRFLEFWNLVFTQYDRQEDGTLVDLPQKNIDTGMGLERMAAIMQQVHSNYETDILAALIGRVEEISGKTFGKREQDSISMRIIADHARAVTFMVGDGILPSNEGRGYVLRRLLRRAARHGYLLGIEGAFLSRMVDVIVEKMGDVYPEIVERRTLIDGIISAEETRFLETLKTGTLYLEEALQKLEVGATLDGKTAFTLHDTYGFPFELTEELAQEHQVSVDRDGFEVCMHEQRERARAQVKDVSWSTYNTAWVSLVDQYKATKFVGDAENETNSHILALVIDGQEVEQASAGAEVDILLDVTPFYGERGGQIGDTGTMTVFDETGSAIAELEILDTRIEEKTLVVSHARVISGSVEAGQAVHASINAPRRERIRRNHTATHLLHDALRAVLGDHVTQAGSYVADNRLRFDFTHFENLSPAEIAEVERLVNQAVMENHPVSHYETSLDEAKAQGVMALFGEKYGERVRVLEIEGISRELCGGTHVRQTSEIGLFKITSISSVGANVRRIEALTSFDALAYLDSRDHIVREAAALLKAKPEDLIKKIEQVQDKERAAKAEITRLKREGVGSGAGLAGDLLAAAVQKEPYTLVVAQVPECEAGDLREIFDQLKQVDQSVAAVIATISAKGSPILMAAGSKTAVSHGFHAGNVIKAIAPAINGGGGGKPQMAQAGGSKPEGIDEALAQARAMYVV